MSEATQQAERRAALVWPGVVIGLLVACIGGQTAIAIAARGSRGLTVQRPEEVPAPPARRP